MTLPVRGKLQGSMYQPEVFILIAPDFDERAIVDSLCTFRAEGIATRLVSLSAGLLTGSYGLAIKPDLSLTQFEQMQRQMLNGRYTLIISSSQPMTAALQTDPRVQHIIETTFATDGLVAFMAPVPPFVDQFGQEANLRLQTEIGAEQFMTQIVNESLVF